MNAIEWRKNYYDPRLIIARELTAHTSADILIGRIDKRLSSLINRFGYEAVEEVIAHTIKSRTTEFSSDLVRWANGIADIDQCTETFSSKRSFYELRLNLGRKAVSELQRNFVKEFAYA